MPSKTVQCFVLLVALLQLGEIQGEVSQPGNEGSNDSGGVLGEYVRRQEFDQLKQELYFWQNTTIRILNKYLLAEQGDDDQCASIETRSLELHQKLDQLEEAGSNHSREVNKRLAQLESHLVALIVSPNPSNDGHTPNCSNSGHTPNGSHTPNCSNSGHTPNGGHTPNCSNSGHTPNCSNDGHTPNPSNDGHTPNCSNGDHTPKCSNGSLTDPTTSCKYIKPRSPSGRYWIQSTKHRNATTEVYCDLTRECCGSTGGWMRVAHLDMTDSNQHCPPGFRLITTPRRMCGRPSTLGQTWWNGGCVSTTFPVHGVEYRKVCGRVIGYQYHSPDAFRPYYNNRRLTIDDVYVEGVSLTHGSSPRKHIWTFAAALDEARSSQDVCPCTRPSSTYYGVVPPFIGQDYFCETGSRTPFQIQYYTEDPLWDGRGCGSYSTCCSFNNPPWFCKELPQPTTDDIELRVCGGNPLTDEDTPLELVELYVQ